MPQAIAWVAAQVASWVTSAAAAAFPGLSSAAIITIGNVTVWATQAALTVGLNAAVSLALMPPVPSPEAMRTPMGETALKRIRGYGRVRVAGGRVLSEVVSGVLHRVFLVCDGRTGGPVAWYFHDKLVTLNGSNEVQETSEGYFAADGNHLVKVDWRLGLPTETAYSALVSAMASNGTPEVYSATSRNDGQSGYYVSFKPGAEKHHTARYPNGKPLVAPVWDMLCIYDWRKDSTASWFEDEVEVFGDGAHRYDDPATWEVLYNPIVQMVHELRTYWGYDWARYFVPNLDILTAEADLCDSAATLKAGGTEPLYECHFAFTSDVPLSEIIKQFRLSCDGWISRDRRGALVIRAGHYIAPTVTIGPDEIIDYDWQSFVEDARAYNVLQPSFIDPANDYRSAEAPPWVFDDDVTSRGGERPTPFGPLPVHSRRQSRWLAKRERPRLLGARGTIKTKLSARRGLGHRYLRFQAGPDEAEELQDLVAEVVGDPVIGDDGLSITWPVCVADPDIDDGWNPETDEDGSVVVDVPDRPPGEGLYQPTITDVTVFYQYGASGYLPRLKVIVEDPQREDWRYALRWRRAGGAAWTEEPPQDGLLGGYFSADFPNGEYQYGGETYSDPSSITSWEFARASGGYATTAAGMLEYFSTAEPRITDQGLLIEDAATNLVLRSQELGTTWTQSRCTIGTDADIAPDGTTTADRIIEDSTASNTHGVQQSISFTSGETYCYSRHFKAGTRSWAQIRLPSAAFGSTGSAYFNLATGAVGTLGGGVTAGVIPLANGWFRCWISKAATATASGNIVALLATGDGGASYSGDGASYIRDWGAQVELGTEPTSYIPTTTTTVTRPADELSVVVLPTSAPTDVVAIVHDGGMVVSDRATLLPADTLDLGASSAGAWVGGYLTSVEVAANPYVITGFVPLNDDVEVQCAFVDSQGAFGPWSATTTKDTTGGTDGNPTPGDPGEGGDPTDPGFPGEIP